MYGIKSHVARTGNSILVHVWLQLILKKETKHRQSNLVIIINTLNHTFITLYLSPPPQHIYLCITYSHICGKLSISFNKQTVNRRCDVILCIACCRRRSLCGLVIREVNCYEDILMFLVTYLWHYCWCLMLLLLSLWSWTAFYESCFHCLS